MIKKIIVVAVTLWTSFVYSQESPNAIQLVVPFAAGGPVDSVARFISTELAEELSVPVLVVNKAGASGQIGIEYILKNKSKTTKILLHSSAVLINPLIKNLDYDPVKDFKLIGYLGYTPFVLISSNRFPYNNVADILKSKDSFSVGNGGIGQRGTLQIPEEVELAHSCKKLVAFPINEIYAVPSTKGVEVYFRICFQLILIIHMNNYISPALICKDDVILLTIIRYEPIQNAQ